MKYRKRSAELDAVKVTAADFNGATWDGSPFTEVPDWLKSALSDGRVSVKRDDRDYALWRVRNARTDSGEEMTAEPGDFITCCPMGFLYVFKGDIFAELYEASTC